MDTHPGFDFAPDATRAAALSRRMHAGLAASLRHVCDQARGIVPFDEAALMSLIDSLEGGATFGAPTFAAYYALVPPLIEGNHDAAIAAFAALAAAKPVTPELRIVALTRDELGARFDTYHSMMNSDPSMPIGMLPPGGELADGFRTRFRRGFNLLEHAVPELAGEVRQIINEVVIVAGDPTLKYQFDGGSHFQLWGALFLNADFHKTDYAMVEVIAHESAHSLLFGFCTEEALVENADEELYASPLRVDPRPMDGIYHATFVSARMHWAMSRLLASGLLDDETSQQVSAALDADVKNFEAGYRVVAAHGRLTPTGRALMDGARRYMAA